MTGVSRWRAQRADGNDNASPCISALGGTPAPRLLHHFARLSCRGAVLLNPKMRGAGDVEVGGGHALLDHLVDADEERSRHLDTVRFCGPQN
jgi:hypothetical protein